jgi:hypothetical protein
MAFADPPRIEQPATAAPPAIGEAPLSITQRVSASSIFPGQQLSYAISVASTRASGNVEVRAQLADQLEILGASSGSGTCNLGNPLVCEVDVAPNRPATILLITRVRQDTPPGTEIVSQVVAQDSQSFTASSDEVRVQVNAPSGSNAPPAPTTAPQAPESGAGGPQVSAPTAAPAATQVPAPTDVPTSSPAPTTDQNPPGGEPTSTATPLAIAQGGAAQPQATVTRAPATQVPTIRPPQRPAQAVIPLPATATVAPAAGLGIGLIGIALVVRAARRVRAGDAAFASEVSRMARLHPLVQMIERVQRATARSAAEAEGIARQMLESLRLR